MDAYKRGMILESKVERESKNKREKKRERKRRAATALLPYAAAALCSNERWELSGCDPPPCVVFFLYL